MIPFPTCFHSKCLLVIPTLSRNFGLINFLGWTLEDVCIELEQKILLQRRQRTGATDGSVSITALYKKIVFDKDAKLGNLTRITQTSEITPESELFISIKRSKELKYRPGVKKGTIYKSKREHLEKLVAQQEDTIFDISAKLESAKIKIKLLEERKFSSTAQKLAEFHIYSSNSNSPPTRQDRIKRRIPSDRVINAFNQKF